MSIVKNTPHILKHSGFSFTTILNKTLDLIQDPGSLGIYVYLASKPHDWQISEKNIQNRFDNGRDYVHARMAELKLLGLLKSTAIKGKDGRVLRWETILYSEPQNTENTLSGENHPTENPDCGDTRGVENPHTTNKRYKQIKDINKPPISPGGDSVKPLLLTISDMLKDNPHNIEEQMITEWVELRKKKNSPITQTAWNRTNKVMTQLAQSGLNPRDCFERMVANGWKGMEVKYFDHDLNKKTTPKHLTPEQRQENEEKIKQREQESFERKQKEKQLSQQRKAAGRPEGLKSLLANMGLRQ